MQPDPCQRAAGVSTFALCDLVLMVRKDEIDAPAMNVERLAQERFAHRRTFDMPAWPSAAPGAWPARKRFVRWLPQNEVHGAALVRRNFDPRAGDHLVESAMGELAVVRFRGHIEQHVALSFVSMP